MFLPTFSREYCGAIRLNFNFNILYGLCNLHHLLSLFYLLYVHAPPRYSSDFIIHFVTYAPVSIPKSMMARKVATHTAYSTAIIFAAAITSHSHIKSVDMRTSIDPKNIWSELKCQRDRIRNIGWVAACWVISGKIIMLQLYTISARQDNQQCISLHEERVYCIVLYCIVLYCIEYCVV